MNNQSVMQVTHQKLTRKDGARRISGTGISFSTHTISDTGNGLAPFLTGDTIRVAGSTDNDGDYLVTTGAVAGTLVVDKTLTTELAGATIEIRTL